MHNPCSETFLDIKFVFVNKFSFFFFFFFCGTFRTKGMLNHDTIIIVLWFYSVVIREKPPSKRCRIRSRVETLLQNRTFKMEAG